MIGVKEDVEALIPGKKYFSFLTIKKQPYNRDCCAILHKKIELYDPETIVDANNGDL
jgi:hypothetical protein